MIKEKELIQYMQYYYDIDKLLNGKYIGYNYIVGKKSLKIRMGSV
jgi:hypothetical protein